MIKYLLNIILLTLVQSYLYGQNDLNYYIVQAKTHSPLIADYKNQSESNKIELDRLKAQYTKSQVTFIAGLAVSPIINRDSGKAMLQLSPKDATKYNGYDIAASNGGVYQAMVNINQPLFNGSKLRMASDQTYVAGQINQNSIKLTEHDIEKIVGDQYILCLQDQKKNSYIEQLIQLIADQIAIINKLVENGLLKQSDLLLINIEKKTQLNLLSMFKSTYRRDLMDLNILCGINDTSFIKLTEIDLQIKTPNIQSNFTEKYRLDSLNLLAIQNNFELKYKPQLNSFANAGSNGVYVPTLPNRFGFSAGLNFSLALYDGHQKTLNRTKTALLINSTQSYKTYFINQNTIRKNKYLTEISSLNERIVTSNDLLNDYKQLLDYYKKEVVTGQQSVSTDILTIKNLALLQRDYVLMQTNKQLLINTYNYWNW